MILDKFLKNILPKIHEIIKDEAPGNIYLLLTWHFMGLLIKGQSEEERWETCRKLALGVENKINLKEGNL